ncbi:flagellar basal body rod protein FlgB [Kordiimonas aestuarii]|uniref:flagellar basal body rod protein FlgB n=1 Tax=Kordiimonas aestuarii TaxID=1005925 RepID=UPI0021D14D36|nr:flagellar basal body rod protein FlgB [Kordiimonas aestuarii]
MDLTNIPIMAALKQRLNWLNNNQAVITENISQADTPGYRAKELEKQQFSGLVEEMSAGTSGTVQMRAKSGRHMDISGGSADNSRIVEIKGREESPNGNSVVLEEEMMTLADNQMKYGMVVNLYKKNLGLLKKAIGKDGGR